MKRVCVIGAGPSGMNLLGQLNRLRDRGIPVEATCYEKQDRPGGLWNLTWRTGVDEWGEPQHCSQYQHLFSNGPKECLELPEYTFEDHFGKPIPSFPPRRVLLDYLEGYWRHLGVDAVQDVRTSHCVREVSFDDATRKFTVRASDLARSRDEVAEFDHVVVASGHFSTPNLPAFAGADTFPGRVLHAHDFRSAREFAGERVLLVGASYSAEDLALQCLKFGARTITISYRTRPMNFDFPHPVEQLPLLEHIDGARCWFRDGTRRDVDAIVLCTGYRHHFPFMAPELRLECANLLHPPDLYRGVQWRGTSPGKRDAGDGQLFYLGMQNQSYTFTMFMLQGLWTAHVIKGLLVTPDRAACRRDVHAMHASNAALVDVVDRIGSQTAYVKQLADDVAYERDVDVTDRFLAFQAHKRADIVTYRDHSHASKHTGRPSPRHRTAWLDLMDDSIEAYIDG
ncbi:MAG: NAD(P)/FAD-dependent oxidoreductase [Planctomycetota bacterium]